MKERFKRAAVMTAAVVGWTLVSPWLGVLLASAMVGAAIGERRKIPSACAECGAAIEARVADLPAAHVDCDEPRLGLVGRADGYAPSGSGDL